MLHHQQHRQKAAGQQHAAIAQHMPHLCTPQPIQDVVAELWVGCAVTCEHQVGEQGCIHRHAMQSTMPHRTKPVGTGTAYADIRMLVPDLQGA